VEGVERLQRGAGRPESARVGRREGSERSWKVRRGTQEEGEPSRCYRIIGHALLRSGGARPRRQRVRRCGSEMPTVACLDAPGAAEQRGVRGRSCRLQAHESAARRSGARGPGRRSQRRGQVQAQRLGAAQRGVGCAQRAASWRLGALRGVARVEERQGEADGRPATARRWEVVERRRAGSVAQQGSGRQCPWKVRLIRCEPQLAACAGGGHGRGSGS
jgi:hypothetical protein